MSVWVERGRFSGAVNQAFREVRDALTGLGLEPGDLVLVACSGGADSLALAIAAQHCAHQIGRTVRQRGIEIRVGAVIVDHQMQPGSGEVAERAAEQCRYLGLDPVIIVPVEVGKAGGPEAAARTARYAALERTAAELGAKAVLLGHTLDDQAESVLLGLARGSGARSLSGIPAQRGVFIRPFLNVRRSTTEAICDLFHQKPWHDPTNAQPVHLRNRIRINAMPALAEAIGPGVPEALARTAAQLAENAEALDFYASELLQRATAPLGDSATASHTLLAQNDGGGSPLLGSAALPQEGSAQKDSNRFPAHDVPYPRHAARIASTSRLPARSDAESQDLYRVKLDIETLMAAPAAVRRRALRLAAIQAGAPASEVNRAQVLAIDALVANWHGQSGHNLPGGVKVSRHCGRLLFD